MVLRNGVKISIPVRLIQRLDSADEDKVTNIIIESDGHGLHWPELDFDLSNSAKYSGYNFNLVGWSKRF